MKKKCERSNPPIEDHRSMSFSKVNFIILLLLFFSLQLSATINPRQTTLSVEFKQATIKEVIDAIEGQTEFNFFYSSDVLNINQTVTLSGKSLSLEALLQLISNQTGLVLTVEQDHILVKKNEAVSTKVSRQNRQISGRVTDSTGLPLPGVTIAVKGTTTGTVTNTEGNYTLSNVPPDAILAFSFVGMQTQEVFINNRTTINVELQEDAIGIEEVVAVGYGTMKKANLTGAVATISSDKINNRPVISAAGALQGADPSVNLTFSSGVLDADYNINIRGVASVNGGTPLVLADGVEVSLNQINPSDIESVSVLKDASSSAIYGAKASSGVILITTKRGENTAGRAIINYRGRTGWSSNTTSTDYINTGYDHVSIVNKFFKSYRGYDMAIFSDEEMQMLYDRRNDITEHPDRPWVTVDNDGKYKYYGNFDWYNYFYNKNRPQHEHNLNITGGNDLVNYYVSGRFLSQDGVFKINTDNYENYSFRSSIEAKLRPWLTYSNSINYNSTMYKFGGYFNESVTISALQSNTISAFVPRNPDGSIVQYTNQLSANSPLASGHAGYLTADMARNSRGNKNLILSNQFDAKITTELTLSASYAYKFRNRLYKYRAMPFEYSSSLGEYDTFISGSVYDFYQESDLEANNHNLNVYATYENNWDKKHNLKIVAGSQYEDYRQTQLIAKQTDLLSDNLSSFSVATGEITLTQDIGAFRTLGFFGRLNYDFEGKYLIEASGRWDGTSRFSARDRWGFFPSASFGWRFSEEEFFEAAKNVISNAKLRTSVGSLGNQQVDYYYYIDEISTDNQLSYTFDGEGVGYYAAVTDPVSSSLTWETVTTYDVGLDLLFLDNRLNFTGDYYVRNTTDMLVNSLTPPSVYGAGTPKANSADLRTNGWEFYLSWNDVLQLTGKPLRYNVGVTLGDYVSKITKYNNPNKLISDYYVGHTLGEIWGYSVEGLFATDEEAADFQSNYVDKAVNNRVYISAEDNYLRAGDVHFKDLNGDYEINEGSGTVNDPGDKKIIGNSLPRYSYSMSMGVDWNGIDFSILFQGIGKQDWYPTAYAYDFWGPYSFPSLSFIHEDFMDNVWSEENPDGYFPRARGYQSYSAGSLGVTNDRYLQDVSYLRLKNLTIGYTLPISNQKIFDKARIYATGENLFYLSNLKKYTKTVDPEVATATRERYSGSGVGYMYSRSFSVGIDITF